MRGVDGHGGAQGLDRAGAIAVLQVLRCDRGPFVGGAGRWRGFAGEAWHDERGRDQKRQHPSASEEVDHHKGEARPAPCRLSKRRDGPWKQGQVRRETGT
jgi:hypothetical protein